MQRMLRTLALLLFGTGLVSALRAQATSPTQPCILGYTVGFFNGVANTELDALISLNQTKGSVEEATGNGNDTYNNEDVQYQVFYNTTGSATFLQDIAETFAQRQDQLDPSGFFSTNNLYMFWEQINGGGSFNYLGYTTTSQGFATFFEDATAAVVAAMAGEIGYLAAHEPTAADYATQNAQLDAVAAAGRKMLLIAHSQGNLFVDQGYDHILPVVGSTRVKVVHVAPASPTLRGNYILSSNDAVINAVRGIGGYGTVANNNITINYAAYEPTGHSMGPTYLDTTPGRTNGRAQVEALELGGFQALTAPSGCAVTLTPNAPTLSPGGSQTFTATLNPTPTDPILLTEYTWTVTGGAGGTLPGGVTTLNTSTPTVTYTVPASAKGGAQDTLSVKVQASKTQGDQVNAVNLGNGSATISVSNVQVTLSPASASINSNQTVTINAVVNGAATPPGSYKWSTSGSDGKLSGTGATGSVTAQTSFCSTSPAVTYTPALPASVTSGSTVRDSVSVQVFTDASCGAASGSAALASATGTVSTTLVKDVSAWIGTWSNCINSSGNTNFYLAVYGKPFPLSPNEYDTGNGDLFFEERSTVNQGVSYGFITVVATDTTLGFDDRFQSYNNALNGGYPVYSIAGGVFTSTSNGNLFFSCTR